MTLSITSTKNPRIKAVQRLRDRRGRSKQGRFVIDGLREISRAIDCGIVPVELYVMDPLPGEWAAAVASLLARVEATEVHQTTVIRVPPQVFEKIAFGERTEGVLAVADTPEPSLDSLPLTDLPDGQPPLLGILERVEKPGNVGAVLRSADGAGLSGLIVADAGTDLYNPNAVRASMGTIFSVPVAAASSADTIEWLRRNNITIHAARVDGSVPYTEVDFRGPSAIVLGNEADGLSDQWRVDDIKAVRLPMLGIADSLNVSVSAAILFYEALRQRTQ